MTYEKFKEVIDILIEQDDRIGKLYKNGIDLADFVDPYHSIIKSLITEVYGEDGYDWFSWFCTESDYGRRKWDDGRPVYDGSGNLVKYGSRHGASDEHGNPICYDIKSLHEYLEKL